MFNILCFKISTVSPNYSHNSLKHETIISTRYAAAVFSIRSLMY